MAMPVFARVWLVTRGLTMGVRAAIFDTEGRVLLIRHGYVAGWHMPGGGVEIGETAREALEREALEEANVTFTGDPVLHGIFHQFRYSKRDHVLVYVVRDFSWNGAHPPNREIQECRFFPLDALPADLNPGTRRRIAEIMYGEPLSQYW
jgi:ADP-ribose pyrophosphatase YjhB (NUDIX family)